MSCFKLPVTLLKEIESITSNFFWNDSEKNKIHWVARDRMCRSKKAGGIGFRNLHAFNLAMLAKQSWRVLKKAELLVSRIFKARYFPHDNFLNAKKNSGMSFTWRSILESRSIIEAGMRWRIGDGQKVKV
ncbi:hypothetical protein Sango_0377200 [Sesamum angolense]|uniref:Uncharacterized protein n=1 Tax=Sesamum angolense TaxID=2727404 RepID=A0AAE1X9U0_9LAMI|nr:hypothetical protein Sango_0377200 [Sesamum angolense]